MSTLYYKTLFHRTIHGAYHTHGYCVPYGTWRKMAWVVDEWHPQGCMCDVTPRPGHTYVRATWPPRNRGRGESLTSPRRMASKFRALRAFQLRIEGYTWRQIAARLGFKDKSGAWRAVNRLFTQEWLDKQRKKAWANH